MRTFFPSGKVVVGTLLVSLSVCCWSANKCVLQDGRVAYQDTPCDRAATAIEMPKRALRDEQRVNDTVERHANEMKKSWDEFNARQAASRERSEAERLKEKIKLDAFCGKLLGAEPAVGMTDKEFFECSTIETWGPRVARTEVLPFQYEVYHFPRKGRTVQIRDGKVIEIRKVALGTVR